VVAGSFGQVGSDERALRHHVRAAHGRKATASLHVEAVADHGFAIGLGGQVDALVELVLIGVSAKEDIAIGRGENRGRTIRYTNALIAEERLSQWSGGKFGYALSADQMRMKGADRYAIILREPAGGAVLAARWLEHDG